MLNFRKLKQDYSPTILKEGKALYDNGKVASAKIVNLNGNTVRLQCKVLGSYDKAYRCEIEIDRRESTTLDSDCDCPSKYDCNHLSAVLFFLEAHLDEILVNYSKEANLEETDEIDENEKATLRETFKEAETKESVRRNKKFQKELLQEYIGASDVLGKSPFFLPEEELVQDKAELAVIFSSQNQQNHPIEVQFALRLPYRSKPLNIPNIKEFLDAVRYHESIYIGSKRYYFSLNSFDSESAQILKMIMDYARVPETKEERNLRIALIDAEAFGAILAHGFGLTLARPITIPKLGADQEPELQTMPCLYCGSLEEPLMISNTPAQFRIELEYLEAPAPKMLLKPTLVLNSGEATKIQDVRLFECAIPGMIHANTYYHFKGSIKRKHLRNLNVLRDITIPEPLFGTFVENSLNEMMKYADVANREIIESFVTLPYAGQLGAECNINYLNGELDAELHFLYGSIKVPASATKLSPNDIYPFVTKQGILARNLTEEQKIIDDLFQGFVFDPSQGVYVAKNDKKIVEFMTEVIPNNQDRVKFNCPENLQDQFIYDETKFKLALRETDRIDVYEADLKVDGHLKGVTLDLLWECVSSKKAFIELASKKNIKRKGSPRHKF